MRRALLAAVVVLAMLLQHWTPTLSPRRATPDQPTGMNPCQPSTTRCVPSPMVRTARGRPSSSTSSKRLALTTS
jgi:hypothetical protein